MSQTASNLIARILRRRQVSPPPASPSVASQFGEAAPPASIRKIARDRGDHWRSLRLLKISVAANIILAGLFLLTAEFTRSRATLVIRTDGDLREQIRVHFADAAVSGKVVKDPLVAFLHIVLPIRYSVTQAGSPYMVLLQGLMTAQLYEESAAAVKRNLDSVKRYEMCQSLVIEEVSGFDYDDRMQRATVVVSGRLITHAKNTAQNKPMAISQSYRSRVVLDVLPASKLNPYGFFVVKLKEATTDAAVRDFDREIEQERARANGKT